MVGAIIGDVVGSVYEWNNIKTEDFPLFIQESRFTDDTVLSVALADAILHQTDVIDKFKEYYAGYPEAGYGARFARWAASDSREPYNSFGNGSAMRASPVGFAYSSMKEVLAQAKLSAEVTHNHPEGVKGAQAVAAAIFLARAGKSKEDIKFFTEQTFDYKLDEPLESIRETYEFDVSCQGSVPQALTAFLESTGFEDAIRKAISLGGDSDTIACIAGGVAQAYYKKIPEPILKAVYEILDERLKQIVFTFSLRFGCFP